MAEKMDSSVSVAEALRRRHQDSEYETVVTHREGIRLRVEQSKRPDILKRKIGRLAIAGRQFNRLKKRIEKLTGQQKRPEAEIKDLATAHDGLRGYESDRDNLRVTVFPTHTIAWDRDKLRDSLGVAYTTVVGEDLQVTMSVPLGHVTEQGALTSEMAHTAIYLGLLSLGFEREALPSIVNSQVLPRVDEVKLHELLTSGQISTVEGAGTVRENWSIRTGELRRIE